VLHCEARQILPKHNLSLGGGALRCGGFVRALGRGMGLLKGF